MAAAGNVKPGFTCYPNYFHDFGNQFQLQFLEEKRFHVGLSAHTSKANSSFSSALIAVAAGGDSALSPFTAAEAAPHSALDEAISTKICPALKITKLPTIFAAEDRGTLYDM